MASTDNNSKRARSINLLASLNAPALDTLPDDWRPIVRQLTHAIHVQALALNVAEQIMAGALQWADAGATKSALRLLRRGHQEITELLACCDREEPPL